MEKEFKSNIQCGACVNTVSTVLNDHPQIKSWEVDTDNPQKIMKIDTELSKDELNDLLSKLGYALE